MGFGTAAGADETVTFGWPVKLNKPLEVSQGGTGANSAASACGNIGAVKKSGDTMSGNLYIQSSLYPSAVPAAHLQWHDESHCVRRIVCRSILFFVVGR